MAARTPNVHGQILSGKMVNHVVDSLPQAVGAVVCHPS